MEQNCLCELALLNIYRKVEISISDIIQRFAKMKKKIYGSNCVENNNT